MVDRVYITKYALSGGVKLEAVEERREDYVYLVGGRWSSFKLGRDCSPSRTEAIAIVEAMRLKKIVSLRKQIKSLEAMVPEELVIVAEAEQQESGSHE